MKTKETIKKLLAKNKEGITITDLHKISKLSKSSIRDSLAELRGSQEVEYRKVGMAKVYKLKEK